MIYTDVVVTVIGSKAGVTSSISNPILLFRGDRNLEISFQIEQQKFKFAKSENMILSTNANFGQLVIEKPDGSKVLSDITECDEGKIKFIISKEMIDELTEVGFYDIQIRLYDDTKIARVTIPPVLNAIEVKEPIIVDDSVEIDTTSSAVNEAMINYASVQESEPIADSDYFDENGKYIKTNWKAGDKITDTKLNKIEESIEAVNDNDISRHVEINSRMTFLENELNEGIEEVHNVASTVDDKIATAQANMTAQVNQGKVDMEAMIAEVEADLDGLHAKDEELSAQVADNTSRIEDWVIYDLEDGKRLELANGTRIVGCRGGSANAGKPMTENPLLTLEGYGSYWSAYPGSTTSVQPIAALSLNYGSSAGGAAGQAWGGLDFKAGVVDGNDIHTPLRSVFAIDDRGNITPMEQKDKANIGSATAGYNNIYANAIILKSPNGTSYKVTVSDDGTLTTTEV